MLFIILTEVILLLKIDIRKENCISVLRSVARRNNTITKIKEDTKIGYQTIWYITKDLVKKGYLIESELKSEKRGRNPKSFDVSPKFYSTYVIERHRIYSIISINIDGRVSYRYDYFKRRDLSLKDDVKRLIGKIRRAPFYKKRCVNVFLTCSDETAQFLPDDYIRTSKEEMIINGLSSDRVTSLFKINNEITLSLYSHIVTPDPTISEEIIKKIVPIDEFYEYDGELFYGIFDALQSNTIKNFYKLL